MWYKCGIKLNKLNEVIKKAHIPMGYGFKYAISYTKIYNANKLFKLILNTYLK